DSLFGVPVTMLWDHMAVGIALGGACIRFGCIRNGCCVGRPSDRWFALRQHDVRGVSVRRIPVQWIEIGWWIAAALGRVVLRRFHLPTGSQALAVVAWYGVGRFWLEPLRETPNLVGDRIRVDRVVAAVMAIGATAALLGIGRG